ncbi:MAG: Gfo/Idh/MocA family oxidoreductase [Anaerolineae bacterium]|nr:Gfo/Idh/MocA family oxidoreductase [Anaerolineae bacterium]
MKLLLIGYSKIAQRRVLPALAEAGIAHVDVASRSRAAAVTLPEGAAGRVFDDYETALAESEADLVYVSTVNSTHAEWAERALLHSYHVIVDKPAVTCLDDAHRLVELAQRQGRCLAESTVYGYHPQIAVVKQAFAEAGSHPTRLTATFSFPSLPADNFRYKAACDGGALWDLGPYAVTPGRIFFDEEPQEITCRITGKGDEVETSFSVLMTYSDGRSMVGHFGFNTGYRNRLDILGPQASVAIDRVFTAPASLANEVHINQNNQSKIITVPPADQFALFLRAVVSAIETGPHEALAEDMVSDARVMWRLREAAGMGGSANAQAGVSR